MFVYELDYNVSDRNEILDILKSAAASDFASDKVAQAIAELEATEDDVQVTVEYQGDEVSYSIDSTGIFFNGYNFGYVVRHASYIHTSCVDGDNYARCYSCGEWHEMDDMLTTEEWTPKFFCDSSCAESEDYFTCEYCGELHLRGDMLESPEGYCYCSLDHAEREGYLQCEHCDRLVAEGDGTYVDGYFACESCLDYRFTYCEECEEYYNHHRHDGCPRCEESLLHRYGYVPELQFFGSTDNNAVPFMGVELETDRGNSRSAYVRELATMKNWNKVWLTKDSSLETGVEITSHPCTLDEHLNSGMWDEVFTIAKRNGFVSHNSGNCGLHVHINRDFFGKSEKAQDVGGYKMMRLLQRFKTQFYVLSRRSSTRWCEYELGYKYGLKQKDCSFGGGAESVFYKADHMVKRNRGHAQALNFEHRNTFEMRIWRGTLKPQSFYSSLAITQGLARAAKCHGEIWVETVNWYDLVSWIVADTPQELRSMLATYLNSKGLFNDENITTEED